MGQYVEEEEEGGGAAVAAWHIAACSTGFTSEM